MASDVTKRNNLLEVSSSIDDELERVRIHRSINRSLTHPDRHAHNPHRIRMI